MGCRETRELFMIQVVTRSWTAPPPCVMVRKSKEDPKMSWSNRLELDRGRETEFKHGRTMKGGLYKNLIASMTGNGMVCRRFRTPSAGCVLSTRLRDFYNFHQPSLKAFRFFTRNRTQFPLPSLPYIMQKSHLRSPFVF